MVAGEQPPQHALMEPNDAQRRIESLLRLGLIEAVNLSAKPCPLVRVKCGDILSNWVECWQLQAGRIRSWTPPKKGQQAMLLSPSGESAAGIAITGGPIDAFPAPFSDPDLAGFVADDGAVFTYNLKTHELAIKLPAGALATLTSDLKVVGSIEVTGAIKAAGDITSDADVRAGEISLKKHPHISSLPGTKTSPAQP